jgi:hypothetical protein
VGKPPPFGKRPEELPLAEPLRPVQFPFAEAWTSTDVAFTVSALAPFVPVAEMHAPAVTSLRVAETVWEMTVLAVTSTVVWPLAPWTSSVPPEMLAIFPEAAAPNVPAPMGRLVGAAFPAAVVVGPDDLTAVEPPPPQAAAMTDRATRALTGTTTLKPLSIRTAVFPTTGAFPTTVLFFTLGFPPAFTGLFSRDRDRDTAHSLGLLTGLTHWAYSLRNASIGARRAARDAG